MYKVLNADGVVISTHRELKNAEEKIEFFKKLLPNSVYTIESDEPKEPKEPKEEQNDIVEHVEIGEPIEVVNEELKQITDLPADEMLQQIGFQEDYNITLENVEDMSIKDAMNNMALPEEPEFTQEDIDNTMKTTTVTQDVIDEKYKRIGKLLFELFKELK